MKLTIDHLRARTQATKFAKRIKPDWLIATIGNNAGTVNVSGRDDRIWGLLNGDPNKLIQIERGTTIDEPIATTAVFVEPARKNAAYYRLIGRVTDWYSADAQADIVRGHAAQHQRRDFGAGGFDPLDIYIRALVELRARAQTTPNWTLHVEAGTYINYLGVRTHYAGGNSGAFTKPAVVGQRRCDLLYFDNVGALQILQGTLTLDGSLPTEPTQPDQSVAIAYVYLDATMTAITEDYIFEARTLWTAIASTMPATPHNVLSAQHSDTLADSVVRGDLIYGNATPKWARLGKGAAGTFPVWNATDLIVSKVTITQPATGATLTIADGKTLTINDTITLAGAYNATFPATGTVAMGAGTLTVSTTNDVTGATHTHAITSSSNPGTAAVLLASTAAGLLTLNQFAIPATSSSTVGVIFRGTDRFIHTYNDITNFFAGALAGNFTLSATYSVGIGWKALTALTSGQSNIALGTQTLMACQNGTQNISIGNAALSHTVSGQNNIALGSNALLKSTSDNNFGLGTGTLSSLVEGHDNVGIGTPYVLGALISGSENIFIGGSSGFGILGNDNTGIGYSAGSGLRTTGDNNTWIGAYAGSTVLGSSISNSTAIGTRAEVLISNALVLGGTGSYAINVGINTSFGDGAYVTYKKLNVQDGALLFTGQSSVPHERALALLTPAYVVNTDASRTASLTLSVFDTAQRDCIIIQASGTAPMIGVLGHAAQALPAAYTLTGTPTRTMPTDPSSAYTGIDNAQAGTVYATVADLNTLRGVVSSILGVINQEHADWNGYGWLQ